MGHGRRCIALICLASFYFALETQAKQIEKKIDADSDVCKKANCREGQECMVRKEKAYCICRSQCPDVREPICGSDDITYDNTCFLQRAACMLRTETTVKHAGECKENEKPAHKTHKQVHHISTQPKSTKSHRKPKVEHQKENTKETAPTVTRTKLETIKHPPKQTIVPLPEPYIDPIRDDQIVIKEGKKNTQQQLDQQRWEYLEMQGKERDAAAKRQQDIKQKKQELELEREILKKQNIETEKEWEAEQEHLKKLWIIQKQLEERERRENPDLSKENQPQHPAGVRLLTHLNPGNIWEKTKPEPKALRPGAHKPLKTSRTKARQGYHHPRLPEHLAKQLAHGKFQRHPMVCYIEERKAMWKHLIEWLIGQLYEQANQGTSYPDIVDTFFRMCDLDSNYYVDTAEFITCMERRTDLQKFVVADDVEEEAVNVLRSLCIDALLVMADGNTDWQLSREEFVKVMDPEYTPPNRKCSLEGKDYDDGYETKVECNLCVCTCGNWVCVQTECKKKNSNKQLSGPENTVSPNERKNRLALPTLPSKPDKIQQNEFGKYHPKEAKQDGNPQETEIMPDMDSNTAGEGVNIEKMQTSPEKSKLAKHNRKVPSNNQVPPPPLVPNSDSKNKENQDILETENKDASGGEPNNKYSNNKRVSDKKRKSSHDSRRKGISSTSSKEESGGKTEVKSKLVKNNVKVDIDKERRGKGGNQEEGDNKKERNKQLKKLRSQDKKARKSRRRKKTSHHHEKANAEKDSN